MAGITGQGTTFNLPNYTGELFAITPDAAVLWNGANRSQDLVGARYVDLVGILETNVWNGASRVQMRLSDFRRAADS